jgi:hypothetical protein
MQKEVNQDEKIKADYYTTFTFKFTIKNIQFHAVRIMRPVDLIRGVAEPGRRPCLNVRTQPICYFIFQTFKVENIY